ncbi:MAG: hypothetical protein J6M62_09010 [Selenomonadaceae bacterium]|nr:hypothetical protein [Selenomonadaceae bacterium]MBP3722152.1 hypothetical protein [Selenomonadaceae bacterium]
MKYKIIVEEVISDEFNIEADSEKEAINKAIKMYKLGDIVIAPGNLEHKQLAIVKSDSHKLEWIEF